MLHLILAYNGSLDDSDGKVCLDFLIRFLVQLYALFVLY